MGKGPSGFPGQEPSVMAYAEENPAFEREDRCGCSVKPGDVSCGWWKLLLDETTDVDSFDPTLRSVISDDILRLPEGKSAEEVATDYLTFVCNHIMQQLSEVLKTGLKVTPLVFSLTVPSTWTLAAREKTRQAAKNAGFTTRPGDELHMLDEPQAGILDVLHSIRAASTETCSPSSQALSSSIVIWMAVLSVNHGNDIQYLSLLTETDLITYEVIDQLAAAEAC
jgi:hypothetical protein